MFSFAKKEQSDHSRLAIGFHHDGISLAIIESSIDGVLSLERLEFREVRSAEAVGAELKILISEAGGQQLPCICVLNAASYSLIQLEAPDVEGDELKSAVSWRIKDLIDFAIEDAVIDLIPLPASKRPGAPRMMYAVAARKRRIEEVVSLFEALGVSLKAIDIPELALRNLTFADAEENRAAALLFLTTRGSLIEICDNGSLCLTRNINLDFASLDLQDDARRNEMIDLLSLEVQRSLDYYESQFANGAVSSILMSADGEISMQDFVAVAGNYLVQPIQELQSLQQLAGIERFSRKLVSQCLPTIGGALRDFAWRE